MEAPSLFIERSEKEALLMSADFRLRGVTDRGWVKVRRLLLAIETTPAEARTVEVLAAKMVVSRSTCFVALELARQLTPAVITVREQRGKQTAMAVDWCGVRQWTNGQRISAGPVRSKSDPSDLSRTRPKEIGPVRVEPIGTANIGDCGAPRPAKSDPSDFERLGIGKEVQGTEVFENQISKNLSVPPPPGKRIDWGRTISDDDLRRGDVLDRLFAIAVEQGFRAATEHDQIEFFALAWRCAKSGNRPAGLFTWSINRGAWSRIRAGDEDAARRFLHARRAALPRQSAVCDDPDAEAASERATAIRLLREFAARSETVPAARLESS